MAKCPNCGNETAAGAVFCDQCGTRLPTQETGATATPAEAAVEASPAPVPETSPGAAASSVICPACGAGNVPGEAFCDYCGTPLEAPAPAAEAPAPAAEAPVVPSPAPEVVEPQPATAAGAAVHCPACGAEVLAGEAYCANCGTPLAPPPAALAPAPEVAALPEAELAQPAVEPVVEAAPPPAPPVPAGPPHCPACGTEVAQGDKFCSNCGAVLQPVPLPAAGEAAVAAAPAPAGPRLVVVASGAEIPLPAKEEILIGREDPVSGVFPDVDLTPHGGEEGGVSRRHARLLVEGGNYYVEDLDSTNFTFVNKQKLAPRTRTAAKDGDEIRCGRVALSLKVG